MNEDNQKIAIAEACGYSKFGTRTYSDDGDIAITAHLNGEFCDVLNYLNDLNAMHEAEETLTEHEWNQMFEWLIHIRWRDANATERYGIGKQKALSPSRATSAQRAEAFLRVKNKWEK